MDPIQHNGGPDSQRWSSVGPILTSASALYELPMQSVYDINAV